MLGYYKVRISYKGDRWKHNSTKGVIASDVIGAITLVKAHAHNLDWQDLKVWSVAYHGQVDIYDL